MYLPGSHIEEVDKQIDDIPNENTPSFLAFARVYSGTIHRGQTLYVLNPRYSPSDVIDHALLDTPPNSIDCPLPDHTSIITVGSLYLLMGRDVVETESVTAGNVMGVAGLDEAIVKSATLSSTLACPAFRQLNFLTHPIVHVAIEPIRLVDLPLLLTGFKLLCQADPCVKLTVQDSGEHVLSATGEVHLQRCLDDLRNTYAKGVELKVSPPIVPFRETVVAPPTLDMVNELIGGDNEINYKDDDGVSPSNKGPVTISIPSIKSCTITFEASPLPDDVIKLLEFNAHSLKLLSTQSNQLNDDVISQLYDQLNQSFLHNNMADVVDHIWSFGPRLNGPNILLNKIPGYRRPSVWGVVKGVTEEGMSFMEYDNSIVSGFQLASLYGPLCDEPLHGVCISVLDWTPPTSTDLAHIGDTSTGSISGQLISITKEGCRQAVLAQPTRLMMAMYSCIIQVGVVIVGVVPSVF